MRQTARWIAPLLSVALVVSACSRNDQPAGTGAAEPASTSAAAPASSPAASQTESSSGEASAATSSDAAGSPTSEGTTPTSGASSSAQEASPSATSGSAAEAAPVTGSGNITVGAAQGIPQLNPAIRTFAWEEVLFPLLWNALSKTTADGEVVPDLAEWTASSDSKTWTFTLTKDVKFSNGKQLTSADVVKTLAYYRDPKTPTQEANKLAPIDSVTAKDDKTVVITLKTPNAIFPAALVWVKILDIDSLSTIDKDPAVTGPYKVKSFTPDNSLTLVRNDSHVGDKAPLDQITFVKAAESAAAANSLASGDLDALWSVPQSDVDQFTGNADITIVTPKVPSQWPSWEVDTTSPPFNNVKARQALAYAVDRKQVLEAAYFGQGVESPTNNPLGTSNPWFSGEGLTDYSYDLAKAKQLFAEAGVKEGDTLTWWGVAGQYPEWNTAGQILQASLKEIGINLKIDNNDISTWVGKFYPAGKKYPGMIVPNFQSTPVEPAYSINFLIKGRCECNWDDKDFQAAYDKAISTQDETERKAAWAAVQKIVNEQVPVIVPLQSTVVTATSTKLKNVWVDGGGQLHLENAGLAG